MHLYQNPRRAQKAVVVHVERTGEYKSIDPQVNILQIYILSDSNYLFNFGTFHQMFKEILSML